MEKIDPIVYLHASKPISPLLGNFQRFSPQFFICKNETNLIFFNEEIFNKDIEQNLLFLDFPITDLIKKFQMTYLENIVNFLNKKEQKKIYLVNWNRQIFRNLMLGFSKSDIREPTKSIQELFTKGFFVDGESFLQFNQKNEKILDQFFKDIQDNTFSDCLNSSKEKLVDKSMTNIFVIQEYTHIWSGNDKPSHKISICKNPRNIFKSFKNKAKKGNIICYYYT